MLEYLYINTIEQYKIKNNYSLQEKMQAHMYVKSNNIEIYGLYNGEKSNTIEKNGVKIADINIIYSNLIDKATHKRRIKDIKIHLLK